MPEPARDPIVYRCSYDIPELDIRAGDTVVLRLGEPEPIDVVRRHGQSTLEHLIRDGHLGRMQRVGGDSGVTALPTPPSLATGPRTRPRALRPVL